MVRSPIKSRPSREILPTEAIHEPNPGLVQGRRHAVPPGKQSTAGIALHLPVQPGFRVRPPTLRSRFGNTQDRRGLFEGESDEVPQFDELHLRRIERRKTSEHFVQCEELILIHGRGDVEVIDVFVGRPGSPTLRLLSAGAVHQDPAHGLRRSGKEVPPIFPVRLGVRSQPQPRLVNQRRRLKRVTRRLLRHFLRRDLPKLGIHQFKQLRRRPGIARPNRSQDLSGITHRVDNRWHLIRVPPLKIALTKHFDELIARLVASGRYDNSSEVVRAGLRILEGEEKSLAVVSFPPGSLRHLYTPAGNHAERRTAKASTLKVEPE